MLHSVMAPAQQLEILQRCRTTVEPVLDVMGIAPPSRPIAAGDDAPAVSHHERPADGRWDGSSPAPHVQGLRRTVGDQAADAGVTGDTPGRAGADDARLFELAWPSAPVFQRFERYEQSDVGLLPAPNRSVSVIEVVAAQVDESVGPALSGSPLV